MSPETADFALEVGRQIRERHAKIILPTPWPWNYWKREAMVREGEVWLAAHTIVHDEMMKRGTVR